MVTMAQNYDKAGRADFNGDGVINAADQQILEANLGKFLPAPATFSTERIKRPQDPAGILEGAPGLI
jgi:hypothetical protein